MADQRLVSPVLLVLMVVVLAAGAVFWIPRLRSPVGARGQLARGPSEPSAVPTPSPAARSDGVATRALVAAGIAPPTAGSAQTVMGSAKMAAPADPTPLETGAHPAEISGAQPNAPEPGEGMASSSEMKPLPLETGGELIKVAADRPPAMPAAWPRFQVKGVVLGRAGLGSVILDRGIVEVGQTTIDGVRVVRIEGEVAVMEFQGEERSFRVGSTSP